MAIKSTLVTPPNKAKEIDWSKSQLLICNQLVILTNGDHCGDYFSGVAICKDHVSGLMEINWYKPKFQPITTPITITFENE